MTPPAFPFDSVVGQDEAKMALLLATVDHRIGGVLLRGHKGTAKTTLARGLAELLGEVPFVELPLGATEDRVVGTIDTVAALTGEGERFRPGILHEAHGGVLYVDEINLLADHLVDVLLDVSVSGVNIVERDGMSHRHPSAFVLVGSMNPEEGELRPQLLDRFGLCVDITTPVDVATRAEAVRRRLAFDGHRLSGIPATEPLTSSVTRSPSALEPVLSSSSSASGVGAVPGTIPETVVEAAALLAAEVGTEGLRADLTLCRAAAALAGLSGRAEATAADMRVVAPLVLAHRRRRGPFDPPVLDRRQLDETLDKVVPPFDADNRSDGDRGGGGNGNANDDTDGNADEGNDHDADDADDAEPGRSPRRSSERPLAVGELRATPVTRPGTTTDGRGRYVRDLPLSGGERVSVAATARALAGRRADDPKASLRPEDLRTEVRVTRTPRTLVLCVDLSGSMGADGRARAATGVAIGLLSDAYLRRHKVALVGFRDTGATVVLSPTSSVEVARNRLVDLVTGGETPLAAGISLGLQVAEQSVSDRAEALLAVLTDGRATGSPDAVEQAMEAAATVRRRGIQSMVLDCETGPLRLNLAGPLAEAMGAPCVDASSLDLPLLTDAVRHRVDV